MPKWLMVTGLGTPPAMVAGTTNYYPMCGALERYHIETFMQAIARDTYTLADLLVRVIANTLDGTTTVRTRVNAGNGNQSVSILTTQTGTFQDTDNSDALVDGNLFNYQAVALGTSGTIKFPIMSTTLATAVNTTPIIGSSIIQQLGASATKYNAIVGGGGDYTSSCGSAVEAHAQYTFRAASTLSNLRAANARAYNLEDSTVQLRINGGNGNLSYLVPGGTSGAFEDAVSTDVIGIGDEVCIAFVLGAATGGGATLLTYGTTLKSTSIGRQTACACADGAVGDHSQEWDEIFYFPLESCTLGWIATATEADVQCLTRMAFIARNFFVNVAVNTTNGARTINTRVNGGDGNLSVSIPAANTGFFEDLAHTDDVIATDLYNYKVGGGGTSGAISTAIIGFEQEQAPAPPPVGLENKSANMGAKMVAAGLI